MQTVETAKREGAAFIVMTTTVAARSSAASSAAWPTASSGPPRARWWRDARRTKEGPLSRQPLTSGGVAGFLALAAVAFVIAPAGTPIAAQEREALAARGKGALRGEGLPRLSHERRAHRQAPPRW
jgi:hypothetical protein